MRIVEEAAGLPLSAAIEVGGLVFVSGRVPTRDGKLSGEGIAAQTEVVIDRIAEALEPFGLTLTNVVKSTVWITEASFFGEFNQVYARRFTAPYPTRSTVVSGLALPGALVEIEVIASKDETRG
jgi:2-iminobutanoate/2-iminopropanoate deaminase